MHQTENSSFNRRRFLSGTMALSALDAAQQALDFVALRCVAMQFSDLDQVV
jgi:hypothetical protein